LAAVRRPARGPEGRRKTAPGGAVAKGGRAAERLPAFGVVVGVEFAAEVE
jgi:hypothetical protein